MTSLRKAIRGVILMEHTTKPDRSHQEPWQTRLFLPDHSCSMEIKKIGSVVLP